MWRGGRRSPRHRCGVSGVDGSACPAGGLISTPDRTARSLVDGFRQRSFDGFSEPAMRAVARSARSWSTVRSGVWCDVPSQSPRRGLPAQGCVEGTYCPGAAAAVLGAVGLACRNRFGPGGEDDQVQGPGRHGVEVLDTRSRPQPQRPRVGHSHVVTLDVPSHVVEYLPPPAGAASVPRARPGRLPQASNRFSRGACRASLRAASDTHKELRHARSSERALTS